MATGRRIPRESERELDARDTMLAITPNRVKTCEIQWSQIWSYDQRRMLAKSTHDTCMLDAIAGCTTALDIERSEGSTKTMIRDIVWT